jgi:hypothetical protein
MLSTQEERKTEQWEAKLQDQALTMVVKQE